ncbi:hypothetical protein SAMN05443639_113119 [Stigmatella erecta]|uniref:Uncharacterized protein n=2 Tax=Stigmatella erecta TaxID=83460 RepID=A0A1I0KRP8_9BACT|nr:hypothetical protein SAMN05443639_113119 [Stigmatella erecta]
MERCWDQRYPWPHNKEQSGWYYETCMTRCRAQFVDCEEEHEQRPGERDRKLSFPRMEQAIDWIREHKEEVMIGTLVIAGGAAFVLAISPLGWLVLVPMGIAAT